MQELPQRKPLRKPGLAKSEKRAGGETAEAGRRSQGRCQINWPCLLDWLSVLPLLGHGIDDKLTEEGAFRGVNTGLRQEVGWRIRIESSRLFGKKRGTEESFRCLIWRPDCKVAYRFNVKRLGERRGCGFANCAQDADWLIRQLSHRHAGRRLHNITRNYI